MQEAQHPKAEAQHFTKTVTNNSEEKQVIWQSSGKHRDLERTTASSQLSLSDPTALVLTWQESSVHTVNMKITAMATQAHPLSKGQQDWAFCFSASTNPETRQSSYCYTPSGGSDFPHGGMSNLLCQNLAAINARLSAHDAMKFYKLSGPCMPGKGGWD